MTTTYLAASAGVGKVRFVRGLGPVDLLTLRAVRALGEADVLIADADGILDSTLNPIELMPPLNDQVIKETMTATAAKLRQAAAAPAGSTTTFTCANSISPVFRLNFARIISERLRYSFL